jgi:hypothetical protein
VTVISSSPEEDGVVSVAAQAVPAEPPSIAEMAYASFWLIFNRLSLKNQLHKYDNVAHESVTHETERQ